MKTTEKVYRWTCDMCFPDVVEYGEIMPGLAVAKKGEDYLLVGGQGHRDDVLVTFTKRPYPDPITPEIEERAEAQSDEDAEVDADVLDAFQQSDSWLEQARLEMDQLRGFGEDLRGAWRFVGNLVLGGGYDPEADGSVEFWLYNQIGKLVEEFERS